MPSLLSCLENDRARTWYISLSEGDKTLLRTSTEDWKILLKCDYGIQPFQANQNAQRETFSFADGKPVLKYLDQKIACFRLAGQHDKDMQCHEIKEGIRNHEFGSQIQLTNQGNTLAWLCQELIELEVAYQISYSPSTRSLHSPSNRFPSIPQRLTPITSRHRPVPANAEVTKVNSVRHFFLNAHYTSHTCDTCQDAFTSRNLLFAHLNKMNRFSSKDIKAPIDITIIQSKANPASVVSGYTFRDFAVSPRKALPDRSRFCSR